MKITKVKAIIIHTICKEGDHLYLQNRTKFFFDVPVKSDRIYKIITKLTKKEFIADDLLLFRASPVTNEHLPIYGNIANSNPYDTVKGYEIIWIPIQVIKGGNIKPISKFLTAYRNQKEVHQANTEKRRLEAIEILKDAIKNLQPKENENRTYK